MQGWNLVTRFGPVVTLITGIGGGVVLFVNVVGIYYTQTATISQLERRVQGLETRTDKAQSEITNLNQRISVLEAKPDTSQSQVIDLKNQVRTINDQLNAINEKANKALIQASNKPLSPLVKKCAELAEEADTGSDGFRLSSSVTEKALILIDRLGCRAAQ